MEEECCGALKGVAYLERQPAHPVEGTSHIDGCLDAVWPVMRKLAKAGERMPQKLSNGNARSKLSFPLLEN